MALLWVDGFETYGDTNGSAPSPTDVISRSYSVSYESYMDIEAGRLGSGHSLELNSSASYIRTPALTTDDTMTIGFAAKCVDSGYYFIVSFYDDTTQGVYFRIYSSGLVIAYRGSTELARSSVNLSFNAWYWFEIKVKCNASTGSYEFRIGETDVLSATSQNTKEGTHDYHNRIGFQCNGSADWRIDDFYVVDSTGSSNNDFLGNVKVQTLRPDGTGNSDQFTPSAGNNYECVDETIIDDDTSYVESGTTAHIDTYAYDDTASGTASIKGIQINTCCKETDANSFDLVTMTRRGTTDYTSSADTIGSTDYVNKFSVQDTDPSTSAAWTKLNLDAAEFGIKVG